MDYFKICQDLLDDSGQSHYFSTNTLLGASLDHPYVKEYKIDFLVVPVAESFGLMAMGDLKRAREYANFLQGKELARGKHVAILRGSGIPEKIQVGGIFLSYEHLSWNYAQPNKDKYLLSPPFGTIFLSEFYCKEAIWRSREQ